MHNNISNKLSFAGEEIDCTIKILFPLIFSLISTYSSPSENLSEISILNKPFIAIPLPSAKDNHQMKNAQFYEELGCCWVLDQRNLKKEKLSNIILNILKDKSDLIDKKSNLEKLNFENSWNDVNQKLQKIINEN